MLGRLAVSALALVAAIATGGCETTSPADDFCTSYGAAMQNLVRAAREYQSTPEVFATTLKSTKDSFPQLRAKAPDDTTRAAFDKASFTFDVFGVESALADFLTRADFSGNAVVLACADYGVMLHIS